MDSELRSITLELNEETLDQLEWASLYLKNIVNKEISLSEIVEIALSISLHDLKQKSGSSKLATKMYQAKNYGLERGSNYSGVWVI